jgi:hypothetical protein
MAGMKDLLDILYGRITPIGILCLLLLCLNILWILIILSNAAKFQQKHPKVIGLSFLISQISLIISIFCVAADTVGIRDLFLMLSLWP